MAIEAVAWTTVPREGGVSKKKKKKTQAKSPRNQSHAGKGFLIQVCKEEGIEVGRRVREKVVSRVAEGGEE